jgi:hypothetical protein
MHIKHALSVLMLSLCAAGGLAQNYNDIHLPIYTRVGSADFNYSPKEETLIHEYPYQNAKTIGLLSYCIYGLCGATLIKNLGDRYLVDDGGTIGYVRATEAVLQSWFDGDGDSIIIAAKPKTYIYVESYDEEDGDGIVISGEYVAMGTIITDRIEEAGEDYYVLMTAHDYLYVHKNDVEIISRKELALQALQYQMQKE